MPTNLYSAATTDILLSTKLSARSVNPQTANYALTSTDANNIVSCDGYSIVISVPQDSTYNFPVGTVVMICTNNTYNGITIVSEDMMSTTPSINQSNSVSLGQGKHLVKIAANTWAAF